MDLSNTSYCCELLSKIIIFVTRHNQIHESNYTFSVVNCFQKLLSSWHETTFLFDNLTFRTLWIAFKNYYLRDTKQQTQHDHHHLACCELLSKIIIFVTRNNTSWILIENNCVVNCFQKLLSSWHETTSRISGSSRGSLWIAFKNYYLRDTKQLMALDR